MLDLAPNGDAPSQTPDKAKGSALRIYLRLLRYTWQYKFKLLISLVFAIFIAASFTSMLFSVGKVVHLTYYDGPAETDPQVDILKGIQKFNENVVTAIDWLPGDGWASYLQPPTALETSFTTLVSTMRDKKSTVLSVTAILLVGFSLLIGIARFIQEYFAGSIGANISTDLARKMYENLMKQSVGFFEARGTGDVLSRFTNDIFMVNRGLASVLVKLMREPIKALFFLLVALSIDPMLTLVGICGLPPVALILTKIGKKMRKSVRRSLEKVASLASVVNETVGGISIVKVFTMERYEMERVHGEINRLRRFLFQMVRLNAAAGPTTEFILLVSVAAFVMVAGQRLEAGMDIGSLLTLFLALAMLLDPVRKLSAVNNMIQTSVASAERVFEFIDSKPDIVERPAASDLPPMTQGIQFDQVSFGYIPDTPVLRGISVDIKVGETVALVGPSGSGKSTFIKLLPRFYDAQSGCVRIDGVDIRDVTLQSLRAQISLVTQDTILFAESVRENIAAGRTDYTQEQIEHAARAANAAEFIEKLPWGYDTCLAEAGTTLSGGQRQRLAIARAFIKDPSILILDEATSSLDSESERLIQDALDHFLNGRTAFIIAHRLSTIQRADRILVIEKGSIVEQGSHEELLALNGVYRRLYETQFGRKEESP
ncbi:MAG: ABC transporter ATP-binding protein/permease [Candidatus Hydrogenedentes bacterium]|nr:ABC transporter ATP-binding protein/permease [Candidatus Hydrogenedentota bacterium]